MFEGKAVQERDIKNIASARRNPIIANLFHRMRYMERRGSGLKKILISTANLPGYTDAYKSEFRSTDTDFIVVLKNVNYDLCSNTQVRTQVNTQVELQDKIINFCTTAKCNTEILEAIGYKNAKNFTKNHLKPLLDFGKETTENFV